MKTQPATTSVRERNKERLRNDLIEAVLHLVDTEGLPGCSVEAVSRHVGCSKATVYAYFPEGRDEILCALYEQITEGLIADALQQREEASDPKGRIIAICRALLDLSSKPRIGKFYAHINVSLVPVLTPVLGGASGKYTQLIAEDLSEAGIDNASAMSVLIVGAAREAIAKIADNPARKTEFLAAISGMVDAVLGSGQAADDSPAFPRGKKDERQNR